MEQITVPAAPAQVPLTVAPEHDLRFRLLWVDEANGDEVYGFGAAPLDPLAY